jgi:hypothetical protein
MIISRTTSAIIGEHTNHQLHSAIGDTPKILHSKKIKNKVPQTPIILMYYFNIF